MLAWRGLCLMTVVCGLAGAATAADADLEVTRIALFSSGVGFFECEATVDGNTAAELKFRTEQINDILKSLVVQDMGGGHIGVVSYGSKDPIARTLKSFAVDLTDEPTLGELLAQLRGEPVEIAGSTNVKGVILGVEQQPGLDPKGEVQRIIEFLTVVTENGLQRVQLDHVQGIRLLNDKIDAELRKALATLASAHDADKKSVTLNFEGQGQRQVRVAYLLEAPIWKTSYRLVLSDEKEPLMQGWATVENATEEDWNDVRLALVSGRPISFRMDLYTPLYVPRPLEQLELYASLRPPTYEGSIERDQAFDGPQGGQGMFGESGARMRAKALPAQPAPRMDRRAGGRGGAPEEAAWDAGVMMESAPSIATADEAGELFAYHIDTPVSIPRQHSAMLSILNAPVQGKKVSIYNPATHAKHPLNGLVLTNTTGLHLMQGPITVFDGGLYAGDAKLPDVKPDEQRMIAYALDLSTEVTVERKSTPDELMSLWIKKGVLWRRHKYVDQRDYLIKNKAGKARTVILEQPYTNDWKLVAPAEPHERTDDVLRFKVDAPAQQTARQTVVLERIRDESMILTDTGLDQIRFYLRSPVISPAVRQAMEQVIALRTELDELARRRERLEQEQREAVNEQVRVRDNLKTLDRNTDAYRRQLTLFDELETQIGDSRAQVDRARDEEEQKRKELEAYLLSLNVE